MTHDEAINLLSELAEKIDQKIDPQVESTLFRLDRNHLAAIRTVMSSAKPADRDQSRDEPNV